MIDPKLLRNNSDILRDMLLKRKIDFPLEQLSQIDIKRRENISLLQELRRKKNLLSKTMAIKVKTNDIQPKDYEESSLLTEKISTIEKEQKNLDSEYNDLMMLMPNVLDESVPLGKDESDNVIIRYYKEPKKNNPPDHVDVTNNLDVVDLERAAKISGSRFYFLKNALVRMNIALINFAIDFLEKQDYSLVQPPFLIRRDAMNGAVILNDFDPYKIENEDLYLIGTSEHALVSMHMDEIIDGNKLPLRYAGISPCFRKEAGAHGKDMKGIFRVHQFDKVEQVVFTRPEYSRDEQNRMLNITESFYKELDIPYRVVVLCSGDLGKVSSKTYDIEAWMPGQNAYREIVSCSNCIDYQARRLRIRFRDRTNEETKLLHTLNSTLVATERTIVAIIENYYNSDGTITVPKVLQKYMGGLQIIS